MKSKKFLRKNYTILCPKTWHSSKSTIEETIESAKKQIEEKGYEGNLRERGFSNITKMVFAFRGKECKMEIIK